MLARAHILVSGRVQGVCFRGYTERWASDVKLTGWVRNLGDGRVEIVAEGDRANIEKLLALVRNGPPSARVSRTELEWQEWRGEFSEFRVTW